MNTVIFGVSLRWIIVFLIKGTVIYLFVRVLTGVTKYFFPPFTEAAGQAYS